MSIIKVEKKGSYAILSIASEPVNLMNTKIWQQLKDAFDSLEADQSIRGVIITSGLKRNIFTAGNDINELYAPKTSEEKYSKFWILSNHFLSQVYKSRLATVAAIKGASPAGGCALAMCCDARVMTDTGNIGLNEVALGIPVPKYWTKMMASIIGQAEAERMCLNALQLSPQDALTKGLIDKVVSQEDLIPAAETVLKQMIKFPGVARSETKLGFRGDFCQEWEDFAVQEARTSWAALNDPSVMRTLEAYMKGLGKRSKL